jgi:A/G-specific adenine glycosylase
VKGAERIPAENPPQELTRALLDWYARHARRLPWREKGDAYAVWVSEVMLQQTRVETVIPYYERWMVRFPTLADLAHASQQEVLSAWEGLGYYRRARDLHRAAQIVAKEMGGELPRDLKSLRQLPGVGKYIAGAVASIAFGQDEPALDGNIRRVLARLFDVTEPARSPEGERRLYALAAEHLPSGQASAYNQALMDLGALVCTPRAPDCPSCPLAAMCLARERGIQEERPVLYKKPAIPHFTVTAAVMLRPSSKDRPFVLIAQRPAQGLLGGLWEFPGGKLQDGEGLAACLEREICEELGVKVHVLEQLGVYHHAYTHFRVTLHAFHCALNPDAQPQPIQVDDLRWVHLSELSDYPMGKIDRQIARDIISREDIW